MPADQTRLDFTLPFRVLQSKDQELTRDVNLPASYETADSTFEVESRPGSIKFGSIPLKNPPILHDRGFRLGPKTQLRYGMDRRGHFEVTRVTISFAGLVELTLDTDLVLRLLGPLNALLNQLRVEYQAPWIPNAYPGDIIDLRATYPKRAGRPKGQFVLLANNEASSLDALAVLNSGSPPVYDVLRRRVDEDWAKTYGEALATFFTTDGFRAARTAALSFEYFINELLVARGAQPRDLRKGLQKKMRSLGPVLAGGLDKKAHRRWLNVWLFVLGARNSLAHSSRAVVECKCVPGGGTLSWPVGSARDAAGVLVAVLQLISYIDGLLGGADPGVAELPWNPRLSRADRSFLLFG